MIYDLSSKKGISNLWHDERFIVWKVLNNSESISDKMKAD
jgi:hypothetical protein